jgi:hypothetical protein
VINSFLSDTHGGRGHDLRIAETTPYPIRMKLSVDSLDQSAGFVLFCQTLSEYLGCSVSFS